MILERDGLPPDDPQWYSTAEYSRAIKTLAPTISLSQRRMLVAHATAPDLLLSVQQLAAAAGYSTPNVTYSQYGRLGHAFAQALNHQDKEVVWTRLIGVDSRTASGELVWAMEPALARALIAEGWAHRRVGGDPLLDVQAAESELAGLTETERAAVVLARLGQGSFRGNLIRIHGACMVTGVTEPAALRASHIKPWRVASNAERVDPANGLLLAAHFDALFDAGLISFAVDHRIMISEDLAQGDRARLGIRGDEQLRHVLRTSAPHLAYHRRQVFRDRAAAV